jgi:hypothetical protein
VLLLEAESEQIPLQAASAPRVLASRIHAAAVQRRNRVGDNQVD